MSSETVIWKGTSSQVKNFWWYASCLLVLPIPWAVWNMLKVKCRVFNITTERLIIEQGVFNKKQDTLELYRIRDMQVQQPFWLRLFGLENILLLATDLTTESVVLDYIPSEFNLRDQLRQQIEECRRRKGVREVGIDIEHGAGGDAVPMS
jgi:uncharacterized membrane protein YdbT with pleckstrin-like domain